MMLRYESLVEATNKRVKKVKCFSLVFHFILSVEKIVHTYEVGFCQKWLSSEILWSKICLLCNSRALFRALIFSVFLVACVSVPGILFSFSAILFYCFISAS